MRTVGTIISHFDMDAFFAAVEERNNPQWKGLPIAVGGDPKGGTGRGVLSTANYAARKYGLHSAMSVKKAWELSEAARLRGEPAVIFTSGGFGTYGKVSDGVFRILRATLKDLTPSPSPHMRRGDEPLIRRIGADEGYFDLSFVGSYEEAEKIAKKIKQAIFKKEKLTASIGIGANTLIAKMASDFDKPDGLTLVRSGEEQAWLKPQTLRALPGIGPKSEERLRRQGFTTLGDIQKVELEELKSIMGNSWGESLYRRVRGIGSTNLTSERERKSLGEQRTFYEDTLAPSAVLNRLDEIVGEVWGRWQGTEFSKFRTVVVTVRFADFVTRSRSHTLKNAQNSRSVLYKEALKLLLPFLDRRENPQLKLIRLIGVRLEKLE